MPAAVEELLRFLSIADGLLRVATEDIEIGGQDDPRRRRRASSPPPSSTATRGTFPDPDALDWHRPARHHVAFGFGIHQCLGQNLARAEMEIALLSLFERLPRAAPGRARGRDPLQARGHHPGDARTPRDLVTEAAVTSAIAIDRDVCIGAGQCALTAPRVFTQDDDGFSEVLPGGTEAGGRSRCCGRRPGPARSPPSRSRRAEVLPGRGATGGTGKRRRAPPDPDRPSRSRRPAAADPGPEPTDPGPVACLGPVIPGPRRAPPCPGSTLPGPSPRAGPGPSGRGPARSPEGVPAPGPTVRRLPERPRPSRIPEGADPPTRAPRNACRRRAPVGGPALLAAAGALRVPV